MTAKPPSIVTIDPAEWKNAVGAIEDRWQAVLQPTYSVQAIKESAIKGGRKSHGSEERGADWGEVLHTLLEAAMKQPKADLRGLAIAALECQDLPLALVEDVVITVQRTISSDHGNGWHWSVMNERSMCGIQQLGANSEDSVLDSVGVE